MTTRYVSKFTGCFMGVLGLAAANLYATDAQAMQDPAAPAAPAGDQPAAAMPPSPPPPPPPPPPAAVDLAPPPPAPAAPAAPWAGEPLAGFSDQTAFLRSPDNSFILFPSGRLHSDFYYFKTDGKAPPNNTFLLRRARAELGGWVGSWFFFSIAGDFAAGAPAAANPIAQSNIATTDDFVGIAPFGDLAILQVGQYDAPFTLENRTSDKYFDFIERSITVRAFGIPSNKETGAMVHGILPNKGFYYSLGMFNGDGQNFRNADNKFDFMGRGWVAPLAFGGPEELKSITVGGSFWVGKRVNALPVAAQTTLAGYTFLPTRWNNSAAGTAAASTYELHQDRQMQEYAFEVNAPIMHKFGARWELVWKRQQPFTVDDVTGGKAPTAVTGGDGGKIDGYSTYGELWAWVIGDDKIVGDPGLQLPTRFKKFGVKPAQPGLMLVARLEHLSETVTMYPGSATLSGINNVAGAMKVTSFQAGANYWHSRRFRGSLNYVLNSFSGDTVTKQNLKTEHEVLLRLAIAL